MTDTLILISLMIAAIAVVDLWWKFRRRTSLQIEWLESKLEEMNGDIPQIDVAVNGKRVSAKRR